MTTTRPCGREADRLVAALAADVVPLDEESVVRQLAEHPLRHRLERALADPARAVVPAADVEAGGDVVRKALQDGPVGGERLLQEPGDGMPGGLEARAPGRVDEVRVEREVELYVAAAGRHRVGDQLALDRDRVLDELVVRLVRVGRDAERVHEDRRGRERDLEGAVGDPGQERGLARGRAVDAPEPLLDRGHHQHDGLARIVPELDRAPIGRDPLHRVVEGVEEHPAAKLPVGDDVEPDVGLPPHDPLDGRVGDGTEVNRVGAVVDRREQLRRPKQASDDLSTRRASSRHREHATEPSDAGWEGTAATKVGFA